ncbi:MAG: hypothetical protein H7Z41_20215 [Cytophagales bacterium]|nr:hypothetical protein [Armatimonadota bacterium]
MNEIPPSPGSEDVSPSDSPARPLGDPKVENDLVEEESGIGSSVLDEPGINVSEYLASQQRAARRTRRFLQFALGVAVIAIPVTYLKLSGSFSTDSVKRALGRKVESPKSGSPGGTAGSAPGFSLTDASRNPDGTVNAVPKKTKKSKAIAQDLTDYVYKDLKRVNRDELKALTAFDRVTGKNFTTESLTFSAVQDTVLPSYVRFVRQAESIRPKTAEVQAIHRIFVQSAKVKLLAFEHLSEGKGDKTASWQYGVKAEFDASAQFANQFKVLVNSLANDQGITLP